MNKIFLIIRREYLVRVRKRTFILMTILGPLLFAALMIVPIWLASNFEDDKLIQVIDESGLFEEKLTNTSKIIYVYSNKPIQAAKDSLLKKDDFFAILHIPKINVQNPQGIQIFSKKTVSLDVQLSIEQAIKKIVEYNKLVKSGIDTKTLDSIKTKISINTINLTETGEEDKSSAAAFAISFIGTFLIYMSIFLYGSQVMRGVAEEKTNRIVEVIVSSVSPFQMMMGKIIGVALIGLTQFTLWIVFSLSITYFVSNYFQLDKYSDKQIENTISQIPKEQQAAKAGQAIEINKVMEALSTIDFPLILGSFLFYFIGGYFLYSALFAAVASAVDSETETQQFMLPISSPIILSFVVAQIVVRDPDGPVAFWMSMIPLTSPIIMMLRVPFGVPLWELLLSMFLLIAGFITTTWMAARIYRIGILMYGKKVTFKELGKWIFYKM